MVITMAKLRMAHASTHDALKPPGPISCSILGLKTVLNRTHCDRFWMDGHIFCLLQGCVHRPPESAGSGIVYPRHMLNKSDLAGTYMKENQAICCRKINFWKPARCKPKISWILDKYPKSRGKYFAKKAKLSRR